MKILVTIAILAAAVAGVMYFGDSKIFGGLEMGDAIWTLIYAIFIFSIAGSFVLHYRGRMSTAILSLFAWLGIFAAAIIGYTYRTEFSIVATRVMDEVVPGRQIKSEPGEAAAVRSGNGHFVFEGLTNGTPLRFLFDTGASTVVLRHEDARRIGLKVESLDFSVPVSTANGRTLTAAASINELTIGSITQRRVRALVGKPGALQENLLGMSFLGQLKGYSVEGSRLVLRQ